LIFISWELVEVAFNSHWLSVIYLNFEVFPMISVDLRWINKNWFLLIEIARNQRKSSEIGEIKKLVRSFVDKANWNRIGNWYSSFSFIVHSKFWEVDTYTIAMASIDFNWFQVISCIWNQFVPSLMQQFQFLSIPILWINGNWLELRLELTGTDQNWLELALKYTHLD
jgi:hypothetical protein